MTPKHYLTAAHNSRITAEINIPTTYTSILEIKSTSYQQVSTISESQHISTLTSKKKASSPTSKYNYNPRLTTTLQLTHNIINCRKVERIYTLRCKITKNTEVYQTKVTHSKTSHSKDQSKINESVFKTFPQLHHFQATRCYTRTNYVYPKTVVAGIPNQNYSCTIPRLQTAQYPKPKKGQPTLQ